MDSSASASLPSVPFYGLQSKKRSRNIKRAIESSSKRLKNEKIPSAFHSRILGPSTRWQIFYRQQEALDFAIRKTEDLHVFAFECRQPEKQSGQRQFLTATYPVFWHYYMQLDETQRHHYEVIPEGHPCKLYFDLEFHIAANPAADGVTMVETVIKYVFCWLKALYGIHCDRDNVLELSASTDTKFSRHLIFQMEGSVFKDNLTAGDFVRAIFSLLEDHLYRVFEHGEGTRQLPPCQHRTCVGEDMAEIHENITGPVSSPASVLTDSEMMCRSVNVVFDGVQGSEDPVCCNDAVPFAEDKTVDSQVNSSVPLVSGEGSMKGAESTGRMKCFCKTKHDENFDCHADRQGECSVCSMPLLKESSRNTTENGKHSARGVACQKEVHQSACATETATNMPVGYSSHMEKKEHEFNKKSLSEREKTALPINKNIQMQESVEDKVSVYETVVGLMEEQTTSGDFQVTKDKMIDLCDWVFQQFEVGELKALLVKDREGKDACFVDLGVYTKNRNFRLYKSCKLGKTTAFAVAATNTYTVDSVTDDSHREREIFLASLITNVKGSEKLLTFGDRDSSTQPPHMQRKNKEAHSQEHIEGCGKSPYPEVDDFISSQVSGHGGAVRRWTYFPTAEILSYDIIGYRFCYNVQRQHRSNNIRLVVDLQKGVWYQKCYDPDCQAVSFKSQEFKLPRGILPADYFTDDFDDVNDFNMGEDDEACLLALQDVEQGVISPESVT